VFPSFLVLVVEDLGVVAPPTAVLDRLQSYWEAQGLSAREARGLTVSTACSAKARGRAIERSRRNAASDQAGFEGIVCCSHSENL
jgi:hypothetical protein